MTVLPKTLFKILMWSHLNLRISTLIGVRALSGILLTTTLLTGHSAYSAAKISRPNTCGLTPGVYKLVEMNRPSTTETEQIDQFESFLVISTSHGGLAYLQILSTSRAKSQSMYQMRSFELNELRVAMEEFTSSSTQLAYLETQCMDKIFSIVETFIPLQNRNRALSADSPEAIKANLPPIDQVSRIISQKNEHSLSLVLSSADQHIEMLFEKTNKEDFEFVKALRIYHLENDQAENHK